MFETLTLAPLRLPEDAPVWRAQLAPEAARREDYDAHFDFLTLAYGAVWKPDKQVVVLVCPKLGPLARHLRAARIEGDAGPLVPGRLRRYRRYDELWLAAEGDPGARLAVRLPEQAGGAELSCGVMPDLGGAFDGLACLTTKSKDNELAWIADWARHHARGQGTQGVLLVDNGSTGYPPEAVSEVLAASGLEAGLVLSAPLPFGPTAKTAPKNLARFFQTAMLNLARHWAFPRAGAVAVNDVDELFVSRGGRSLYEAASGFWGYATAKGHWRLRDGGGGMPRHAEHILREVPERFCKEKYCVRPGGRLGGQAWDVHGIARYQWNDLCRARDQYFLHCREITTGWKYDRGPRDETSEVSEETRAVLAHTLGGA